MNKKQFEKLFGENPLDVMGNDWKNDYMNMMTSAEKIIKKYKKL
jgi:hypothetical protein